MDVTQMLNKKGSISSSTAHQNHQQSQMRRVSEILPALRNGTGYPSPTEPSQPLTMLPENFDPSPPFEGMYLDRQPLGETRAPSNLRVNTNVAQSPANDGSRTFPCGNCGKGFARRSDLARHERIHTGDRPHVCPEPGCAKPFIQRSALTVHMRVHSGEKPHMCERCGKPFSDSSSLARHRRIHSGKRPYKCPFADCQKTFTRRTTLTRHQNHHTGTVEEAAANTAAALAAGLPEHQRRTSTGTNYSDTNSQMSVSVGTPSPSESNFSLSPGADLPPVLPLERQSSVGYHSDSMPLHQLRPGFQQPSPRSSPAASSPSLSAFGGNNGPNPFAHRPSITSHPALPVLEPPAYHEPRSGSGSPHLSSVSGWQSPVPSSIPSMPSPMASDFQMYSDAPPPPNVPLYLNSNNMRRPSSAEPDHYGIRPRIGSTSSGPVW